MRQLPLGRDQDPRVPGDISAFSLAVRKTGWTILTLLGLRLMTRLLYPRGTVSHRKVNGAVAFTIDDGFCGRDNPDGCMLGDVRRLFKEHGARATFFVVGSHCAHTSDAAVAALLADGHELASHGMRDHPYTSASAAEFTDDLDATEAVLAGYRAAAPAWYRAPFGRCNARMRGVLERRGMTHVLCDVFAHDTAIPDASWIARFILRRVRPGSIILIHMPERGCREWNLEAMRQTLRGLSDKRLEVCTVSELTAERSA